MQKAMRQAQLLLHSVAIAIGLIVITHIEVPLYIIPSVGTYRTVSSVSASKMPSGRDVMELWGSHL